MKPSGWKAKALVLRETVLMAGHQLANELTSDEALTFDLMRQARRAMRDGDERRLGELQAELQRLTSQGPQTPMVSEPMTSNGWTVNAGFYLRDGKLHWLVGAKFNQRSMKPRDRHILAGILDVLGGHIDHDALSTHTVEELVSEGIPFTWTWINQAQLMEMQIKGKGPSAKSRIVPFGTPPSDGYEALHLRGKDGESAR